MSSRDARLGASSLALVLLLAGCASSAPEDHGRIVVGQGTADDRQAIEASDERMFQSERDVISSPETPAAPTKKSSSSGPTPAASESTTPNPTGPSSTTP